MPALVMAVAVLLAQVDATNPQKDADSDRVQFERWQKYYRTVAAEYVMEQGKEPLTKLTLQPDPVLSYANPAGGGRSHGATFVWTGPSSASCSFGRSLSTGLTSRPPNATARSSSGSRIGTRNC